MKKMIKINLLKADRDQKPVKEVDREIREEETDRNINYLAIGSAVVLILGLVVFMIFSVNSRYNRVRKERDAKRAELSKIEKVLERLKKFEKINEMLTLKLELINDLRSQRKKTVQMMDHLSLNLPDKMWLSNLKFAGNNLSLQGSAISPNLITDFLRKLEGAGEFFDPKDLTEARRESSGLDIFNFSIKVKFRMPSGGVRGPDIQGNLEEGDKYVYDPANRNDPFMDLMLSKKLEVQREKFEGIAGMLIDEVDLEAIYRIGGGAYEAIVKGPDGRPYILTVGDFLYDGEVIEITEYVVKFKKSLQMVVDGKKSAIVEKTTNLEER